MFMWADPVVKQSSGFNQSGLRERVDFVIMNYARLSAF